MPYLPWDDDAPDEARDRAPGGTPPWPVAGGRPQHMAGDGRGVPPLLLGVSLGANVTLLACLLGVLLFARAGDFPPLRSTSPSIPRGATPSPTPTALGSLTVSPATVYPCVGGPDATFTVTYAGSAATLTVKAPSSHEFRVSVNGGTFGYTVTASTSAGTPATVTVHARFGGSDTITLTVNVSGVPQQSVTANTSGGTCGGG